jgi:hypothetical protein
VTERANVEILEISTSKSQAFKTLIVYRPEYQRG